MKYILKKIKTFTLFKESLVDRYSNEIDYIVYIPFDGGPGSEVEKVYNFLISKGVVFPGDPSDNTVIYLDDLYVKYILVNIKSNQMTYNTRYHGTYEKEDLIYFLVVNGDIPDGKGVYIVNDFMDLKKFYIPLNINNYFDNRNIYESLLDKLEGPSKQDAINGLNDKFANDELKPEEYFEKLIENGFLREIDDFLYGYDYDYETVNYGLYIAIDYKKYDVIEYFLNLGIDKSDIEIQLKGKYIDEKIKIMLQNYLNKKG